MPSKTKRSRAAAVNSVGLYTSSTERESKTAYRVPPMPKVWQLSSLFCVMGNFLRVFVMTDLTPMIHPLQPALIE